MDMANDSKRGTGRSPDFIPVPFVFSRKNLTPYHIVVGDDPVQIRFLAQCLIPNCDPLENSGAQKVDRATDDLLVGRESALLHVYAAHRIDLSPEMRSKTTIWAADPIVKGSAAMNAIVKFAATLPGLEKKLTKDEVELVGAKLAKTRWSDLRAMLWEAASIINGDLTPPKRWLDPWESPIDWLDPKTMNVKQRLHTLYGTLIAYTYVHYFNPEAVKKLGIKPSKEKKLKSLNLDPTKVYKTITLLSQWKQGVWNDIICAGLIAATW
jgi:hypothetical protein